MSDDAAPACGHDLLERVSMPAGSKAHGKRDLYRCRTCGLTFWVRTVA